MELVSSLVVKCNLDLDLYPSALYYYFSSLPFLSIWLSILACRDKN